jgi:hypothetical protein
MPTQLLTTVQAAEFLSLKPNTLEMWRCERPVKLPYVKNGRWVRYKLADLEKFIEKNTVKAS